MTTRILTLLFIACLLSGCTLYQIDSADITDDYYPSKQSIQDVKYLETIDQPHEIIGYVIVNAERRQYLSEVLEKMSREAAILGGDAITGIKSDATGVWKNLPAQEVIGNAYVRSNFKAAVAILK